MVAWTVDIRLISHPWAWHAYYTRSVAHYNIHLRQTMIPVWRISQQYNAQPRVTLTPSPLLVSPPLYNELHVSQPSSPSRGFPPRWTPFESSDCGGSVCWALAGSTVISRSSGTRYGSVKWAGRLVPQRFAALRIDRSSKMWVSGCGALGSPLWSG